MRDKNCGNCEHCYTGGNARRFRCMAIPHNPADWWEGLPSGHWCASHWTPKTTPDEKVSGAVKVPSKNDKKE